jgi:cation:H+ antiporter
VSGLAGLALLAAGVVVVVAGAELFLAGLLGVAGRLGVAPFALTVVVSGLETENIAAGIAANANDLPGAAAGTFLGGTVFLALGVSGLGALVRPLEARLPGRALLWTASAPVPVVVLGLDGELSRIDASLLLAWFPVALVGLARSAPPVAEEAAPSRGAGAFVRLFGGLAILTAGGDLLAEGIRKSATGLAVSDALLGNTVVAAGVEGEEVIRVAVPARRGRADVALANVVGTIVHFVALNAGVIALVRPLELDDETRFFYLPAALAATLVLCAVLALRGGLRRLDGALLVGLYAAFLAAAVGLPRR